MSVIWYKVWFDIWRHKVRTMLVVSSIAVGIFAVGTSFAVSLEMLPALDTAHHDSIPPHFTVYMRTPIDRDTILALKSVPGVLDVEAQNYISVRYKKTPEDTWHQGVILMRDDFTNQKFEVMTLKAGAWPEGNNLGIERMHSPFYHLGIGSHVIMEVGNLERTFTIAGLIRHPFVPPPMMYDLAYFFGDAQMVEKFGVPQGKFAQVQVRVTPYSSEFAHQVATLVKARLNNQNIGVAAIVYQDPDKHWGRPFVEGSSIVTNVVAVVSLLLSVVLVMNTMTSIITQQTNQIGILKAIGSSRREVIKIYLASVLAYGALALLLALPLGVMAAYAMIHWYLGLFNIDYNTMQVSMPAVIVQVVAALTIPALAALIPIMQGSAITVREAISSYGIGADFKSTRIDQYVEKLSSRFLATHYVTALVNIFRRKGRLILTELVLVIAGIMFLMVMSLSSSIKATLDAEFSRRSHDVIVTFKEPQRIQRATAIAETLPGVEKADMWVVYPVTILHKGQKVKEAGIGSQLNGVALDDPMYTPLVVQGRWLEEGDERAIVISQDMATDENIHLGETLTLDMGDLGKADWVVVGLYKNFAVFSAGFSVDSLYASRPAVLQAAKKVGRTDTLLVRTHEHSFNATRDIANQLETVFKDNNMEPYQIETNPQLRRTSDSSFGITVTMLLVLALIIALVGAIGLAGALSISVIERTKEIGVLRSIGARSATILRMFLLEGIVQGLISWVIAIPLSLVLAPLLANALGQAMFSTKLEFGYNFGAVLFWLGIILVFSVVASILPARSATRVNVRQSLAYE